MKRSQRAKMTARCDAKSCNLFIHSSLWVGLLWGVMSTAFAFHWQDLWVTKDKQAEIMLEKGQFKQAEETFLRDDWRAASAYRAGDYDKAAQLYRALSGGDADFNAGNALAHLGKYQEAIAAYDKALQKNPEHQDAEYNRKLIEELQKQQQQQQKQKQKQKQQEKSDANQKNQPNKEQRTDAEQQQDKSSDDSSPQEEQSSEKKQPNEQKENKPATSDDVPEEKPREEKQPESQPPDKSEPNDEPLKSARAKAHENQQAKDQWLRLIPDDPGGLLREKFLRDHLRRQRGWQP